MRRLTAIVVFFWTIPAHSWDSQCRLPSGAACPEGPPAAYARWRADGNDGTDEHRRIFDRGMLDAELPSELRGSFKLAIWTSRTDALSLVPFDSEGVLTTLERDISEFSQLPDFGYSLGDWATGFRTCPALFLEPLGICHSFRDHMGMLNSSHFVPQSRTFYTHYHRLALSKASECKTMRTRLGPRATEHREFVVECMREALILEAVGQHYLQDAWSVGHMWERWGSADLIDFSPLSTSGSYQEPFWRGVITAMTAGLIHGSEPVEPHLPDAMCYPTRGVAFQMVAASAGAKAGAGDLHLTDVLTLPEYVAQSSRMAECVRSGIAEVYQATGASSESGGISPVSENCFGQRDTNFGMSLGFSGEGGFAWFLDLLVPVVASYTRQTDVREPGLVPLNILAEYNADLVTLGMRIWLHSLSPLATDAAEGGLGDFLKIRPNSAYARGNGLPAPYSDPPLPWPTDPWGETPDRTVALARMFHRGHAEDWCTVMTRDDLERLRDASAPAAGQGHQDHIDFCVEFVRRHITSGAAQEQLAGCAPVPPLCRLLTGGRAQEIEFGTTSMSAEELAAAWCDNEEPDGVSTESPCRKTDTADAGSGRNQGGSIAVPDRGCAYHDFNVDRNDPCPDLTNVYDNDSPPSRCWHCSNEGACGGGSQNVCCTLARVADGDCPYDQSYSGTAPRNPCAGCAVR